MEKMFRPSFSMAGDSSIALFPEIYSENANDATFGSVLCNGTPETLIPFPLDFPVGTSKSPPIANSLLAAGFTFPSEEYPALNQTPELGENPDNSDTRFCPVYSAGLRVPKIEPFWHEHSTAADLTQSFDFFSDSKALDLTGSLSFNHLPYLHSLEQPQTKKLQLAESTSRKRSRFDSLATSSYPQTLDSFAQQNFLPGESSSRPTCHRELARKRRHSISDKFRCLQKLLPWDKKMDTATMLEEAHKYVSFLQAQIKSLRSMPVDTSFTITPQAFDNGVVGPLGSLNRQQLLQVLVNSPAAQTLLYSQGCCVFSIEQVNFV